MYMDIDYKVEGLEIHEEESCRDMYVYTCILAQRNQCQTLVENKTTGNTIYFLIRVPTKNPLDC